MSDSPADTLCWHCSKLYPLAAATCPHCCATNANVDLASAEMERIDPKQIDHDFKPQDDSFDHEFGTEVIHYFRCARCGAEREAQPSDYHD